MGYFIITILIDWDVFVKSIKKEPSYLKTLKPAARIGKILHVLNSQPFANILFLFLLIIPIYLPFKYNLIPLQDLPNHLANVKILLDYNSSPFLRQYFVINWFPYPYLLQDILLLLFMAFGGADFAASLYVAVVAVSIPLGVYYLVKIVHPDKTYLSFFSLPFVWNILLYRGNLSYLLALAFAFVSLGILWKNIFCPTINGKRRWLPLVLMAFLLYLTHLVAFLFTTLLSFVLICFDLFKKRKYRTLVISMAITVALVVVIVFAFRDQLPPYGFVASMTGKVAEAANVFSCLQNGDYYFLVPVFVLLFMLILTGLCRIKVQPLPYILCGVLAVFYLIIPYDLNPLIKPPERVFYMAVFMLPLCCIGKKHLAFEKFTVIILCSITFLYSTHYFDARIGGLSRYLGKARSLLREIPSEKKLLTIRAVGPYVGHIDAYYMIDNNGYVPTLFSAPYMLVQYRQKPDFTTDLNKLSYEMICKYDFVLVGGHNAAVSSYLEKINFTLIKKASVFEIYGKR